MSTPIENNTEGLQEILQAVNALPSAESGGGGGSGGSFEIPTIDLRELGFPDVDEDTLIDDRYEYQELIDENMFRQFKNALELGLVKIVVNIFDEVVTFVASRYSYVRGANERYCAYCSNDYGIHNFWFDFDPDYPGEEYICGFNYETF